METRQAGDPLSDDELVIREDVVGMAPGSRKRPRAVSISSCDSEPLGGYPTKAAVVASDDEEYASEDEYTGLVVQPAPPTAASLLPASKTASLVRGGVARKPVVEEADLAEDPTDAATPAPEFRFGQTVDNIRVSAHPAGAVSSIMVDNGTIVIDRLSGAPVLDSSSTLIIPKLNIVLGRITTLLGPVTACAYAIVVRPPEQLLEVIATHQEPDEAPSEITTNGNEPLEEEELRELQKQLALPLFLRTGAPIHYLLDAVKIIHDPQQYRSKGTDASFTQDDELPPNARPDFSSDEEERQWKAQRKKRRQAIAAGLPIPEDVEDLSSSESEAEFDEEGRIIDYVPKQHRTRRHHQSRSGDNARLPTMIAPCGESQIPIMVVDTTRQSRAAAGGVAGGTLMGKFAPRSATADAAPALAAPSERSYPPVPIIADGALTIKVGHNGMLPVAKPLVGQQSHFPNPIPAQATEDSSHRRTSPAEVFSPPQESTVQQQRPQPVSDRFSWQPTPRQFDATSTAVASSPDVHPTPPTMHQLAPPPQVQASPASNSDAPIVLPQRKVAMPTLPFHLRR